MGDSKLESYEDGLTPQASGTKSMAIEIPSDDEDSMADLDSQERLKKLSENRDTTTGIDAMPMEEDNESLEAAPPTKTQQDDENTVNSGTTTRYHHKNLDDIILPQFIRYQMMIMIEEEKDGDATFQDE